MHSRLRTPFCELVGVDAPIVQTGMGWVAGPSLVSASAEAGALGILASVIVFWFSRQREFRADAGGGRLAGSNKMIAALERSPR